MVKALHHVTVVTHEPDRVISFLRDCLDMEQTAEFELAQQDIAPLFGWQDGDAVVRSRLLGGGDCGLIEVVDGPASQRAVTGDESPTAGILQVSLGVRDVAATLELAERLGVDSVVGPRELSIHGQRLLLALVCLGGIQFQLVQPCSG